MEADTMTEGGRQPTILFFRKFQRPTGGGLKVLDYYRHASASKRFAPRIFVDPSSKRNHFWVGDAGCVNSYDPESADVLFVAGMDWTALDPWPQIEERKPVVNLVQGLRHSDPQDPRFNFLSRRAVRICVGEEIAEGLRSTGECNGPVRIIRMGMDWSALPPSPKVKGGIFIGGMKQAQTALVVAERLRAIGHEVDCQTRWVSRSEFLERVAKAEVAIMLPHAREGFFMPALEAMAMGCGVITTDCGGNREFCIDGVTALVSPPDIDALLSAVERMLQDSTLLKRLRSAAVSVAKNYDIRAERDHFVALLDALDFN
jgi:glycosyltransferase involved in cell wall biosynthesis